MGRLQEPDGYPRLQGNQDESLLEQRDSGPQGRPRGVVGMSLGSFLTICSTRVGMLVPSGLVI